MYKVVTAVTLTVGSIVKMNLLNASWMPALIVMALHELLTFSGVKAVLDLTTGKYL